MTVDSRLAIAGLVGLANVAAVFAGAFVVGSLSYSLPKSLVAVLLAFAAATTFLLGAVPDYVLVRYRLVLPLLLTGRATFLAVTGSGNAQHDFVEVYFTTPFVLVLFAAVATVAVLEYGVRVWSGIAEPKPLF